MATNFRRTTVSDAHNRGMNAARFRNVLALVGFIAALSWFSFAAAAEVERTGALPATASDALRQAVENQGYRVTLDDAWTAELWFGKQLKIEKREPSGALYSELFDGEFVAVLKLPQPMTDYRGQSIPSGLYTLRYQTLPQDGNHMGVAPNPDFLLAIPASTDNSPEQSYPYQKLIALSAKSTATNHPAVIALETAGAAASVTKNERGDIVFTVAVSGEKLGIVLKGTAGQ